MKDAADYRAETPGFQSRELDGRYRAEFDVKTLLISEIIEQPHAYVKSDTGNGGQVTCIVGSAPNFAGFFRDQIALPAR